MGKLVIDDIITPRDMGGFVWWVPIFMAITAAYFIAQYVQTGRVRILGENTVARIREVIVAKLEIISLRYFS